MSSKWESILILPHLEVENVSMFALYTKYHVLAR